ncbi:MAG: nuclear transport factor 2 family protein [Gammaproteobacteria bacterium]|nr:nuclear transport factor 2 family protein [Gammaproteobacteria bacterium]
MSNTSELNEYEAIRQCIQHYIDGAKSARGDDMKPAFHKDATIFGYVGADLFAGPIQGLFDWNDKNDPSPELRAEITKIEIVESIATVRLETDNWLGYRFTDMFTLLKTDGQWQVMNKVFHLHS